jgi:small subunit ribosomal protein S1
MNDEDRGQDAFRAGGNNAPAQSAEPGQASANGDSEMEALLRESDYAFRSLRRGETVEGTVVRVDQDEVLVDVGMKSEGVIPARELYVEGEDAPPLRIGDKTLVYVMNPEGGEGHAILSLRRAQMERSWRDIEELYHRGAIVEAPVVDFNKGGLIVEVKGVRGFVPVSQVLDLRNITRQDGENEEVTQTLSSMNGRRLPLKIIEINRSRNRLILSERAAVQEQRTLRKDELMDQLVPGQVRKGVVSNLTSFGAFVDLGGADGLVHVSEMSYNRVNHPGEILHVGQQVDVMVLTVDRETKKIALSLKRAQPDPWTTVEQQYHVGQVVPAVITKLAKFGAFAKVEEGLEGLIHLSELTDLPVQEAGQVVREGQHVNVKIIHIHSQRRRLGLSVRQAGDQQPAEMQSFGDIDEHGPFATDAMGAFETSAPGDGDASGDTPAGQLGSAQLVGSPHDESALDAIIDQDEDSPSPEAGSTAGEQDTPAAEYEPPDSSPKASESEAAAPEEAPPASPEASEPGDDEEQPGLASAASPGTTTE